MTFVSRVAQPAILLKKESVQQHTCFSEQIERPYVQFEKREKHPRRRATFNPATLLKITLL